MERAHETNLGDDGSTAAQLLEGQDACADAAAQDAFDAWLREAPHQEGEAAPQGDQDRPAWIDQFFRQMFRKAAIREGLIEPTPFDRPGPVRMNLDQLDEPSDVVSFPGTRRAAPTGSLRGPTRKDLLDHYGQRQPRRFYQFDGWRDADEIMGRDQDGQGVTGGVTWELMHGADVRVLIPMPGEASRAEVVALLRKIVDWIERGGEERIAEADGGIPF